MTSMLRARQNLQMALRTTLTFIEYPHGTLVRRIPVGEGRWVETFAHLLSPAAADSPSVIGAPPATSDTPAEND